MKLYDGRWSPETKKQKLPKWWEAWLAGLLLGVGIALGLFWGL